MKKLLIVFMLLSSFAYGQSTNTTNTKFVNGLAAGNGVTPKPTSGLTAGAIWYTTGVGFQVYNGTSWITLGESTGGGVTSFNSRTGIVVPESYDYSGFYVPLGRTLTINGTTQDLTANRIFNVGTVTSVGATAGLGISVGGSSPITSSGTYTITNTLPDQTVVLNGGSGIGITGIYPNFTISNTDPSSGGTVTSITPSYGLTPQSAITNTGSFRVDTAQIQTVANFFPKGDTRYAKTGSTGTVTSVGLTGGTGISIGGASPITSSGTWSITNTAPDKTVVLSNGTGINVTGFYPNFTINNTAPSSGGTVTSITPGYGLTPQTAITSTGTFEVDTLVLDTVYAKIGAIPAQYWQRSGTTLSPLTANDSLNIGAGKLTAGKVLLGDTIPPSSFANERLLVSLTGDGQMEIGVTGKEAAFAAYNWNPINGASAGKMGVIGFHEGDLNPLTGNYFSEIHTTYYTGGVANDFNVFKGGKDGIVFFPTSHVDTTEFIPNTVYIRDGDLKVGGHITTEGVTATGATGSGKFVFDTSPTFITPNIGVATGTSLVTTGELKGNKLTSSNSAPEIDLEFDFNTNFKHSIIGSGYSSTAGLNQLDIKVASGSGTQVTGMSLFGNQAIKFPGLSGTGTEMLVVDNVGSLSRTAIPSGGGGGTVTTVSVNNANGFSGTSSGGTNPALTLSTTVNSPVLAGDGTAISAATTTGTGSTVVLSTSPTLVTPALGTPSALVGTNITGTASGLSIGGNAATATNSTQWNGYVNNFASDATVANWVAVYETSAGGFKRGTASVLQSFLGLGSNAYTSTSYAPIASPALTGNPTAPTQSAGDNSTKIATTAYVDAGLALKLNLSGGTLTGGLNGTTATFSGDVTANSDSTLKKNIKPLVSISTALRNIGAYSYDWKSNDAHAIGLIAQEVQKYFPELVKTDDKGILSMNYQNFTAVLLAGWKDLDDRITKLEQK